MCQHLYGTGHASSVDTCSNPEDQALLVRRQTCGLHHQSPASLPERGDGSGQ